MKTIYIAPPSFHPEGLLNPLRDHLKEAGLNPVILEVPPAGSGVTLANQASFARIQIEKPKLGEKSFALGVSKGGALMHLIAQREPELFSGIMLYGCPMLKQKPWKPVWATTLRILLTSRYRKAVLSGKGICCLKRKDAEDWLFGGVSHDLAYRATLIPESARILQEMMLDSLAPNVHSRLKYQVLTVSEERFHRNSGALEWVGDSLNASYSEVNGTHFGALLNLELHRFLTRLIKSS